MPETNLLHTLVTALWFSTGLFFIASIRALIKALDSMHTEHKEDVRIDRINTNALK